MNKILVNEAQARPLGWSLMLVGAVALLSGCASTQIGDPSTWPATPIQKAQFMPSDEMLSDPNAINRRTRVIVMPARESASSRGQGLADHATRGLESLLTREGGAEIIDRKLGDRLDTEIKLIETLGKSSQGYTGPVLADYAVSVELGPSNYTTVFSEGLSVANKTPGQPPLVIRPRGWVNAGKAALTVRLYELPSLRLVMQQGVEGESSRGGQPSQIFNAAQGLPFVQDAIADAIGDVKGKLLTELSPRGYIVDRRSKDKKSIFRALISRQTGAKPGDTVEILSVRQDVVTIGNTRRTTTEEVKVATGRVSDSVGNDFSWIIIDDEKQAAAVKQGDVVRVRHRNDLINVNNPVKTLTNMFNR